MHHASTLSNLPSSLAPVLPFRGMSNHAFSGVDDDVIIDKAKAILFARLMEQSTFLKDPETVRSYLLLHLALQTYESFGVIFLGVKMQVMAVEDMFKGSLTVTTVYPREVLKRALALGAASVVFYHNHPAGRPEPSIQDHTITRVLKQACNLVDIEVLDHFIVGGEKVYSFAEHGQI